MPDITPALPILFAILGLAAGSFINVLAYRVPAGMSIMGRSHCVGCNRTLTAWELVPVLSFMILRGRCYSCHSPISGQYPVVEVIGGVLAPLALRMHPENLPAAILLALTLEALLLIAVTDARTQRIPDVFSGTFIALAAGYALLSPSWTIVAALVGGGWFAAQWVVSRGRWVGSADILIGAGIGILLGDVPRTIVALASAYIIGALVASLLLATKKKTRNDAISFAPFLALGTVVAVFAGERITMFIIGTL